MLSLKKYRENKNKHTDEKMMKIKCKFAADCFWAGNFYGGTKHKVRSIICQENNNAIQYNNVIFGRVTSRKGSVSVFGVSDFLLAVFNSCLI